MKRFAFAAAGLLAMGAFTIQAADAQVRRGAVRGAEGGAAVGQAHDRVGPRGGEVAGARGAVVSPNGAAAAGSVNCARGQNAAGCRAGATTRTADGEINHQSGVHAEGVNGRELTSTGGLTKSADGTVDQGRTTTASGANGSVTVDGAYTSGSGRSRTVTCSDASGAVVACPSH